MIQNQHQPYDKSSKWLIQHHGDSMLWLAKVGKIENWRPAQAEIVLGKFLSRGKTAPASRMRWDFGYPRK